MNTMNVPVSAIKKAHLGSVRKSGKYFCKLCRCYGIREKKAHLINHHNADKKAMARPSSNELVKIIFVESMGNGKA